MKVFFLTVCLFLPATLFAQAPPQFTIQDLGSLPNFPGCTATALSQSGNVVGYCVSQALGQFLIGAANSPATRAFLYSNGTLSDLNLTQQSTPLPTAVNDSGAVTGAFVNFSLSAGASANGFVYQNGTVQAFEGPLQTLLPLGLTNSGQIAGSRFTIIGLSFNYLVNTAALLTTTAAAKYTTLSAPPGTQGTSAALGISPNGNWVAGASVTSDANAIRGLLWQNQTAQFLPFLAGFQESAATAVNDSGVATGMAFDANLNSLADPIPNADAHAVLFNNGTVTDLGVLQGDRSSIGLGINNSGWVVGFSSNQSPPLALQLAAILEPIGPNFRAFLYANGTMYDLNRLLTNGAGWQLDFAAAVNNAGQIIGTALYQNQQHAFLLTPVPAPQISGVVGAGLSVPAVSTISPNGLFTIYGDKFADSSVSRGVTPADLVNNALPTNLANTCVEGGNTRWGLFYVSAQQINVLAATLPASGTVPVSVITNCDTPNQAATAAVNVPVAASAPEFLYFVAEANGQSPVAAIQASGPSEGEYVGPPGLISGATFAPAHAGDILTAFGVGWGATSSNSPVGTLATAAAGVSGNYSLTLGGQLATVSYAGLTPGFAGLYQVNFTVPSGLAAGNQPLVLTVNGVPTPSGAYITVAQ